MNKLKRGISISITAEESQVLDKLNIQGIKIVDIFRQGLLDYKTELIDNIVEKSQ